MVLPINIYYYKSLVYPDFLVHEKQTKMVHLLHKDGKLAAMRSLLYLLLWRKLT